MALSAGAVVAQFDGDFKGLNKGLQDAQSKIDGFTGGIQKAGSKIGEVFSNIGDAAMKYGKILGVAGTAATVFGIKTAADLQSLSTSFETLTGSAEKGRKVFTDLKKMGATTPFEVGDLAKATQTMLAFGIEVDKTEGYLQMLGDVSMGDKNKLGGLSLAFSQVQSTGRLMGQDLLQMINQGFNPLTIISQKTGRSMKDLKKDMEDGKITTEMVTDAFKTATSEGGLFYKGMERGSKTLSGTFSTLMDNVKLMSAGLVGLADDGTIVEGSLLDLVQKGVNYLNERLGAIDWVKVGQDIKNFVTNTIDGLKAFGAALDFVFGSGYVDDWIEFSGQDEDQPITKFLLNLSNGFLALKDGINQVITPIKSFFERYIIAYIPTLQLFLGILLVLATQVLAGLKGAWEQLKQPVGDLLMAFIDFWETVQPLLQGFLIAITIILVPAFQYLLAVVVQVFSGIITAVSGALNVVTGIIKTVFGVVAGIMTGDFSAAAQGFKQILNGLKEFLWGATKIMISPFRGFIDAVRNILQGINFFQIAVGWIESLISGVKSRASGIGSAISSGLKNALPEGLKKLIPGHANGVRNFAGGLSIVGERGPELVNLPKGSDVFSNEESRRMAGGQGITIETMNIKSGVDWEVGASYLAQKLRLS